MKLDQFMGVSDFFPYKCIWSLFTRGASPFFLWHINWHCTGKTLAVFHLAQKVIFLAQISMITWQEVARGWLDATK